MILILILDQIQAVRAVDSFNFVENTFYSKIENTNHGKIYVLKKISGLFIEKI